MKAAFKSKDVFRRSRELTSDLRFVLSKIDVEIIVGLPFDSHCVNVVEERLSG